MVIQNIFNDPGSQIAQEYCAVIYAPGRKRTRFPENCVQVVEDETAASQGADVEKHLYPGVVVGPSRSSEGFRLYYLVRWL